MRKIGNNIFMLTLVLRSIIIFCIVLVAVRLMGKRQIGDMQPFELVVTLIIADLACIPMSDVSIPIVFGIVPLLTLVVLHHFFTWANRKSVLVRKILNGKPVIVIDEKGINYEALKSLNMTINDLTEGLRVANCFDLSTVAYAIVETNGNISVLLKSGASPVTNDDMKVDVDESVLNVVLINDGKIIDENLKTFNLDKTFIDNVLSKQKVKNLKDVLIFTINSLGQGFFQEKNKQCQSFQVEVKNK